MRKRPNKLSAHAGLLNLPHGTKLHAKPSHKRRPVRPLLVAIVGGSGAGKSWLAAKIKAALGRKSTRLSLDDFYKDRSHLSPDQRAGVNYDHPSAIDWNEVQRAVASLLVGMPARIPCYDFKTHCRQSRTRIIQPKDVVLIDGLWLLWRRNLRPLFAFSVFLDCPAALRLRRRLRRDVSSRGRTRNSVISQFRHSVQPMYNRYVAPQVRWADLVVPPNRQSRAVNQLTELLLLAIAAPHPLRERPYSKPRLNNLNSISSVGY